jgi:hypothetical protein
MPAIQAAQVREAMRRDFTAISAFSMAISFMAAVVLCIQIAQIKSAPEWEISGITAWVVEVAIFGTAVYAWRQGISLSGWTLGILVLVFIRLSLATSAAVGLALVQNLSDFNSALERTSALGPRVCSALFALMVFYPLRLLLPIRSYRKSRKQRYAESAAVGTAIAIAGEGDPALLVGGPGDAIPVWDARGRGSRTGVGHRALQEDPLHPVLELEGTVEVPLRILLAQVPPDLLGESAKEYEGSHPVSIPLEVVLPQLREARVAVKLGDLHDWLPPGVMQAPLQFDVEREAALVLLPLELIVPQVPPEALELPPASPPAWAKVGGEAEPVVFATL